MSLASTRQSAAVSGTGSATSGHRSSAAWNRCSASSRSMTFRNCCCWAIDSIVEKYVHFGLRGKPFAVGGHDNKAVCDGCRAQDRSAADRQRLDLVIDDSHAGVIDAANLRNELASQGQADSPVRPISLTAAQQANCPSGEKIISAEARNRVAGQQEYDSVFE